MKRAFPWVASRDLAISVWTFLAAIALYGFTLCRTIYTGDDGDFLTAMATGGIPHATGYPLFCLLGNLLLRGIAPLPIEPALAINGMVAVFGALAVAVLYRVLRLLVKERFWAGFGALLFAVTPTFWQQCLSCEVYSLSTLFLMALLYLALRWRENPQSNALLAALAFIYGLGLTHHLTLALYLPLFLLLVFTTRRTLFTRRELPVVAKCVGLVALPLLLYLYLPIAAKGDSPVRWGDPQTPLRFLQHVTGDQYRERMQTPLPIIASHFGDFAGTNGYLVRELGFLLLLVPLGFYPLLKKQSRRPFALLLLGIAATNLLFSIRYDIADIYVYYIPTYLVAVIGTTVGMASLFRRALLHLPALAANRRRIRPIAAIAAFAIPLLLCSQRYAEIDQSGNFLEADYAANVFRSAPRNAIVVVTNDSIFSLWYRKWVLHERPDILLFNSRMATILLHYNAWYYWHLIAQYRDSANPLPNGAITGEQAAKGVFTNALFDNAIRRGIPVIVFSNSPILEKEMSQHFDSVPVGLGERLYPKGKTPTDVAIVAENERLWPTFVTRGLYTGWAHSDPLQERIPFRYARAQIRMAQIAERIGHWRTAQTAYAAASKLYKIPEADAGLVRCAKALGRTIAQEVSR